MNDVVKIEKEVVKDVSSVEKKLEEEVVEVEKEIVGILKKGIKSAAVYDKDQITWMNIKGLMTFLPLSVSSSPQVHS